MNWYGTVSAPTHPETYCVYVDHNAYIFSRQVLFDYDKNPLVLYDENICLSEEWLAIFAIHFLNAYILQIHTMLQLVVILNSINTYIFSSHFSGTYDIHVDNKLVGQYENSGSFGELALMYNMPRAATIVATSDGTLWAMVSVCEEIKYL